MGVSRNFLSLDPSSWLLDRNKKNSVGGKHPTVASLFWVPRPPQRALQLLLSRDTLEPRFCKPMLLCIHPTFMWKCARVVPVYMYLFSVHVLSQLLCCSLASDSHFVSTSSLLCKYQPVQASLASNTSTPGKPVLLISPNYSSPFCYISVAFPGVVHILFQNTGIYTSQQAFWCFIQSALQNHRKIF